MNDDRVYLSDMLESIEKIRAYTAAGKAAFLSDTMIQDAVARNFEIIGEAAKRLSDRTKHQEPEIPWRRVCQFRDFLIHNYMKVDTEAVWDAVDVHLGPLHQAVIRLLR